MFFFWSSNKSIVPNASMFPMIWKWATIIFAASSITFLASTVPSVSTLIFNLSSIMLEVEFNSSNKIATF